jgi:hypothetical protein
MRSETEGVPASDGSAPLPRLRLIESILGSLDTRVGMGSDFSH